jgi:hypothetical protein
MLLFIQVSLTCNPYVFFNCVSDVLQAILLLLYKHIALIYFNAEIVKVSLRDMFIYTGWRKSHLRLDVQNFASSVKGLLR